MIALTKGLGDGNFRRTLASTHAWAPYCWINGPIARQLGIDCGQGQINEEANVAIGRFMNLALMNLCGYYVKQDRMGTFGYPMPWCLVEDEQACKRVGWQPYHVRKGFAEDESVVTLGSTLLWGNNMAPSTTDPVKVMELLAWDISERCQFALGSGKQYTFRTILMTEPVAAILAGKYHTPEALERVLISESRRPLKERAFANYYANPGSRKDGGEHNLRQYTAHLGKTEGAKMTDTPAWYDSPEYEMNTVPTMKPGMTAFLITGDSARNKVQTMPGGAYASVKVELPANWSALMMEIPGLRIDGRGNVSINGRPVRELLIEGHRYFGTDVADGSGNLGALQKSSGSSIRTGLQNIRRRSIVYYWETDDYSMNNHYLCADGRTAHVFCRDCADVSAASLLVYPARDDCARGR